MWSSAHHRVKWATWKRTSWPSESSRVVAEINRVTHRERERETETLKLRAPVRTRGVLFRVVWVVRFRIRNFWELDLIRRRGVRIVFVFCPVVWVLFVWFSDWQANYTSYAWKYFLKIIQIGKNYRYHSWWIVSETHQTNWF